MDVDPAAVDNRAFSRFERADEFLKLLSGFLALDLAVEPPNEGQNASEEATLTRLTHILYEYQEQANLLDPYLERMVSPTIDAFRAHSRLAQHHGMNSVSSPKTSRPFVAYSSRARRLTELIYRFVQVRGRKAIVRFFPHQVDDLSTALFCLSPTADPRTRASNGWSYRYIILLWLSLITKIPFDLKRFDGDEELTKSWASELTESASAVTTAQMLEHVGRKYVVYAGLESMGASLLLAGLYTRRDTSSLLSPFVESSIAAIDAGADVFHVIGVLRVLNHIIKADGQLVVVSLSDTLDALARGIKQREGLMANTLVRQLMTKLLCRRMVSSLPPRAARTRLKAKVLVSSTHQSDAGNASTVSNSDIDVPSFVEESLDDIIQYLQDKDTVVRWSAAKGLARISERLPSDFNDQVLDSVLGLFDIHTLPGDEVPFGARGDGGMGVQLPASAESTWHGACLAAAEFARRDLVSPERLPELVRWMSKALYFDVRKGAHSVGSSVRDATAYVLWSLARSQDADSMAPFALEIARRLVAVSVFDREIQIRRAASAAFQESVGRLNIFPNGIDVLRKTDFYAVSVRKNAYLVAAVQVAEHLEYRGFLIDHLIFISIRYWDPDVRLLASQSLRALCELDLLTLGPQVIARVTPLLTSLDGNEVHGALLTLAELAEAAASSSLPLEDLRLETYTTLSKLPPRIVTKYGNELILSAICLLLRRSVTIKALAITGSEAWWKPALDASLKHRDPSVQQSAAKAMGVLSKLQLCIDYVTAASSSFAKATPTHQQGFSRTLGHLDYLTLPHGVKTAVQVLIGALDTASPGYSKSIEARTNACSSLAQILVSSPDQISQALGSETVALIIRTLLSALDDYSVDERGDVGSWVRISAISSFGTISTAFIRSAEIRPRLRDCLPPALYLEGFAALLKQGSERLDTVRREAGAQISLLLQAHSSQQGADSLEDWKPPAFELLCESFMSVNVKELWSEGDALYPLLTPLLAVKLYLRPVLHGLIMSIGSKNEAVRRPAAESMKAFVLSLSTSSSHPEALSTVSFLEEILTYARANFTQNPTFVPILSTFDVILGEELSLPLSESGPGLDLITRILTLTNRNLANLKSVPRVMACMKLVISLLVIQPLRSQIVGYLKILLTHEYPSVRAATAEALYVKLQIIDLMDDESEDGDVVESLLLETSWRASAQFKAAAERVVEVLLRAQ